MSCEYGKIDCSYLDKRCHLCINESQYKQEEVKKKTYGIQKKVTAKSKRMGSTFEDNNDKAVKSMIKDIVSTAPTLNSGAAHQKGDQQIKGIINVMEELKTQQPDRARGHKSFTIKREWLDKLDREAKTEGMEFWYLKFAFCDTDTESYTVIDTQQMMDMIATIIYDRKIAKEADAKVDVANKRRIFIEADNTKLISEIEYLKSLLNQNNIKY